MRRSRGDVVHHALSQNDHDDDNYSYDMNISDSSNNNAQSKSRLYLDIDKDTDTDADIDDTNSDTFVDNEMNIEDPRFKFKASIHSSKPKSYNGISRSTGSQPSSSDYNEEEDEKRNLKKMTKQEFIKAMEMSASAPQLVPTSVWLLIGFVLFVFIGLYVNVQLGGFNDFHGFVFDNDDDVDDAYVVVDNDNNNSNSNDYGKPIIQFNDTETPMPIIDNVKCDTATNNHPTKEPIYGIHYDPDAVLNQHDPFHVAGSNWYGGVFQNPPHPSIPEYLLKNTDDNNGNDNGNKKDKNKDTASSSSNKDDTENSQKENIGYIQYPNIYNNTLVFCSEGDVYLTTIPNNKSSSSASASASLPAMRLTSTVGNVNSPKINPKYPYLIAFTATYTGHREVYLMDLRSNHRSNPSMRLTYMDSQYGALSISGWEDDGATLVVSSYNMEVAMEDVRLYKIGVLVAGAGAQQQQQEQTNGNATATTTTTKKNHNPTRFLAQSSSSSMSPSSPITISNIKPIPLSQAIESVTDEQSGCRFFTRYKQSSNTARYVGGTAENLWAYCPNESLAVPLTDDYNGTSKAAGIYTTMKGKKYLFFLSDRSDTMNLDGGKDEHNHDHDWIPSTMNLWFMPLPTKDDLYHGKKSNIIRPTQLTTVSCQFEGMPLKEYAIDVYTRNIILRIGADLYTIAAPEIEQQLRAASNDTSDSGGNKGGLEATHLPIAVYSDFNNLHERMMPLYNPQDVSTIDAFDSGYNTISALMTARGQLFVNPIIPNKSTLDPYGGGGINMPPRRYRVAPGSLTGGMMRILGSWVLPRLENSQQQLALILATDPLSPKAEMAFYIVNISPSSTINFADVMNLPTPLIGGHLNGGSVKDGGLGSIAVESVTLSPFGRRVAWTDTDGRIVVMSLAIDNVTDTKGPIIHVLPTINENGESMLGIEAGLIFSPAGRYLAIEHSARNQFRIITIADLGDPSEGSITINRMVQATPDRFNSMNPFWGRAPVDFKVDELEEDPSDDLLSTTLYFLTDRDVVLTNNWSPWGTRAPQPYFAKTSVVYALPLIAKGDEMIKNPVEEMYGGSFVGGGAAELMADHQAVWIDALTQNYADVNSTNSTVPDDTNSSSTASDDGKTTKYPTDVEISFGEQSDDMVFARRAYIISEIPASDYFFIHQLPDDPSIILGEKTGSGSAQISVYAIGTFPQNSMDSMPIVISGLYLQNVGISSDRKFMHFTYSGRTKVISNTADGFMTTFASDISDDYTKTFVKNIVDTDQWSLSVWPKLEYQQLYSDAWRMLRDYYYDPNMGNVHWDAVYERCQPLVTRCGRREELDDVLAQMASELSALHVFVYGGEYNDPLHGYGSLRRANEIASFGVSMERSIEWSGYVIKDIPETDPDFNPLDGKMMYSPLSDKTLKLSGQSGLKPGDVIVGVNGEGVMSVPDIHMLLRGMSGRSVRLEVLRINSRSTFSIANRRKMTENYVSEPLIAVPLSPGKAENLRYAAWEWKTRKNAKDLAKQNGFTVGYMHLRSMSGAEGEDSFVRGFYPDFDKQGLIIDVRHNHGGNIDSWLLDVIQRKAWMYWQGRATNITTGGLGWDEQFAFRGHIVVLIDEKTSSDGEGFSRGVSELGLGKLVGTRTWGGGIWLSSDNVLVDGGIATAPEYGTYNGQFGWGLGIEQMGVNPDIVVDNNPRKTFDGTDEQLERAISVLKEWLEAEPIVMPKNPGQHKDMSLNKNAEGCPAFPSK